MSEKHMFRYTPSLMNKEDLEALFVQREDLLARIVDQIHNSAMTLARYHFLLIGPRGTGKTHMVSLVYHRVKEMEDIRDRHLIAWLREEEWGISSFLDLLQRILRALQEEYSDTSLIDRIESLYDLTSESAEKASAEMLKEFVGNRSLLLIVENLDSLFEGLGEEGQKRLRAYLQENPFCSIVATAPSLFSGISMQASPFYGFFAVHHLESLDADQAARMLVKIAHYQGDKELAALLQTPTGQARVKAIHHLAGGNHRIYVIFSQFLTRDSLDQLVEPFLGTMDDLTPYYQSRMMMLSPQQRKIVEFLCEKGHPIPVKEIAQRCFISHQTASSQLKYLREICCVNSIPVGRESYYELREPLMRLCLEVKKYRGEPIRLFVEFLRYFYTRSDLMGMMETADAGSALEKEYLNQALQLYDEEIGDPALQKWFDKYNKSFDKGDYASARKSADKILALRGHKAEEFDYTTRGNAFLALRDYTSALEDFRKSLELNPRFFPNYTGQGVVFNQLQQYEEALIALNTAISLGCTDNSFLWRIKGDALKGLNRYQESLVAYDKAIELGANAINVLNNHADVLFNLGRFEEALNSINKLLELGKDNFAAKKRKALLLMMLGKLNEALELVNDLLQEFPDDIQLVSNKQKLLFLLGNYSESITCFHRLTELVAVVHLDNYFYSYCLIMLGRWNEGYAALDDALQQCVQSDAPELSYPGLIVMSLMLASVNRKFVSKGISILSEVYAKNKLLSELGKGLVDAIGSLMSEGISRSTAHAWRDEWEKLTDTYPEMQLPLRLLGVAVRYKDRKDIRVLLELPIEERKILEPLLGVKEPGDQ